MAGVEYLMGCRVNFIPATCHPDKMHHAKGLCWPCYKKQYNAQPHVKQARKNFEKTPTGRKSRHKYNTSEKGHAAMRKYKKTEKGKISNKEWHLLKEYNLPLEEFNKMSEEQDFRCLICKAILPLCVDHNHETGKVRGLLCRKHNMGLGYFSDDITLLQSAINYLKMSEDND